MVPMVTKTTENNPLFIIIICLIKSYVYANCYVSHKRLDGTHGY